MNLYELNQAGYASLPNMTANEIEKSKEKLRDFLDNTFKYYMLLNHEVKSFTLFTYKGNEYWPTLMAKEMIDVVRTFGKLKAIEIKDDMVEFWIKEHDGVCRMYAAFPYDRGVIEV